MKRSITYTLFYSFVAAFVLIPNRSECQGRLHWVTAYYGGWELGTGSNGYLPVSDVDFSAMTDVVHFAVVPKPDGTLDTLGNDITFEGARALVRAAHAAGARVLYSVGGWNSGPGFIGATSPSNLVKFVTTLSLFMTGRGYDGIDVDWEPLAPQDEEQFRLFLKTLRSAIGPHYLLTTTAAQGMGELMASVQGFVDRINIMTYDLSFPSPGWVTWYNGALHQNGKTFRSTGNPLPACDNIVESFISAGVPRDKIGIGIEFGGSVWKGGETSDGNGVTRPDESWTVPPSFTPDVPYYTIMRDYYKKDRYRWDPGAMASYLTIDSAGTSGDCFVSYDDSSDIARKIDYVRKDGLGGVILYELGMGYMGNRRNPLLETVKTSAFGKGAAYGRRGPNLQARRK